MLPIHKCCALEMTCMHRVNIFLFRLKLTVPFFDQKGSTPEDLFYSEKLSLKDISLPSFLFSWTITQIPFRPFSFTLDLSKTPSQRLAVYSYIPSSPELVEGLRVYKEHASYVRLPLLHYCLISPVFNHVNILLYRPSHLPILLVRSFFEHS